MVVGRRSLDDRIINLLIYIVCSLALFAAIYPVYLVILSSLSDPAYVVNGKVWFFPKGFTLLGYEAIFKDTRIWIGYRNTIIYAGLGTLISLAITLPAAYALSRREMMIRKLIMQLFTFTILFSGGLIPTFLVVRAVGLYDTIWAIVLPWSVSVWNLIITRTYFLSTIPEELRDSAIIDGSTNLLFFVRIVLPLSRAIVAVVSLYSIVGHWNGYFNALVYLRRESLRPLQLFLREILISYDTVENLDPSGLWNNMVEIIRHGVIVVSIIPLLILYPFIQRYFVTGVMVGSLKG